MRSGPLRHKWFAAFTASVTSGSIGDEIMRLALPLLVLDLTHDIAAAAILRVGDGARALRVPVPALARGLPADAAAERRGSRVRGAAHGGECEERGRRGLHVHLEEHGPPGAVRADVHQQSR